MDVNEMGRSWADEQAMRWLYRRIALGLFVAALLLGVIGAAVADDAASAKKVPDFVPFVVDQQQDAAARAFLNEMRFRDAAPLWNWLNELEGRAKAQWLADNAPKPPPEVPK